MIIRFIIPLCWVLGFSILTYSTKSLTDGMPAIVQGWKGIFTYAVQCYWTYIMVSLYPVCALLYLCAVRIMPLSTAGPLFLIMGILVTSLLAIICFGESVTLLKVIGLVCSFIGAVLVAVG